MYKLSIHFTTDCHGLVIFYSLVSFLLWQSIDEADVMYCVVLNTSVFRWQTYQTLKTIKNHSSIWDFMKQHFLSSVMVLCLAELYGKIIIGTFFKILSVLQCTVKSADWFIDCLIDWVFASDISTTAEITAIKYSILLHRSMFYMQNLYFPINCENVVQYAKRSIFQRWNPRDHGLGLEAIWTGPWPWPWSHKLSLPVWC